MSILPVAARDTGKAGLIWRRSHSGNGWDQPRDLRTQMIRETSEFLSIALRHPERFPRIPRMRVDAGGFSLVLKHPGARALVKHWWNKALTEYNRRQ